MNTRQHIQKKHPSQSTYTPVQNLYQTRAFDIQQQPSHSSSGQENVDLDADHEQSQYNRYNLPYIPVNAPGTEPPPPIQTKLTIGQPVDKYEQEADQVASQVVQQINSPVSEQSAQGQTVQREEVPEEEEQVQAKSISNTIQREEVPEEEQLQGKSLKGEMAATPNLETSIQGARGSGQPLDENIRQPMEKAFGGVDFSQVKVHNDAVSDQLNQSIQARAFTTGQDLFFRGGEYNPSSRGGQELIAHELTHVVQQVGGSSLQRRAGISVQRKCDACEAEEAEVVNKTSSINFAKSTDQLLQRQPSPSAASGIHPPGDCTHGEHRQLQNEVNEWCKNKPRSCKKSQTIEELEERIENNSRCIAARNRINKKCFRGGDAGHKEALEIAINSIKICQRARDHVKAPQPQAQTSKAPQPQPEMSSDFLKKMSAITGLTGAALITYLIISEGSRLFPPRNLIPVP
ncbi:MAG: DUF4157 domain-containing protein [Aphanizomenon flos-aquae DEX188]|nr:MAG: DUF4157 domain-containing protein [Aphanizomenon flos-aquae DEX188]